jgi:hypothetical protein
VLLADPRPGPKRHSTFFRSGRRGYPAADIESTARSGGGAERTQFLPDRLAS